MSTRQRTHHTTHPRELRWLVPTYPRIAHAPYQPNAARDDLVASEAEAAIVFGAARLTVTEKFDGACLALARHDGVAVAATKDHVLRKAYRKETQAKQQFVDVWRWCDEHRRRFEYLERARGGPVSVFGEWLRMPHTVRYSAATPRFVAFEIYDAGARAFLDPLLAEELLRAAGFAVADRLPIERMTAWEELATLARGAGRARGRGRKDRRRRKAHAPVQDDPAGLRARAIFQGEGMINEQELDVPIRRLVRALNAFPGIRTRGSCGGHDNPGPGQWPAGTWYVTFEVDRTDHGWFSLEFLAWLINNDYGAAGHHVTLYPTAAPPYLNQPGQCLHFALEGYDNENADELAAWIAELRTKYFIPPKSVKHARASTRQRSKRRN